jgi:predicted TIM-barrel fold metal-dependent hydrolase
VKVGEVVTTQAFRTASSIDYPIIDADAHVNEPPDTWQSRVPAKYKERAPRVERTDEGDVWLYDGGKAGSMQLGITAVAGLTPLQFKVKGETYETIRPGSFDTKARLTDMTHDGIYAQVLYPSVALRAGRSLRTERDLHLAIVRAYNEWLFEFCESSGGRLIPQGIIPVTGVNDAIEELKWMLTSELFKGALLSCWPNGGYQTLPEDDAFWGLAAEAEFPVAVHIGGMTLPNPAAPPIRLGTIEHLAQGAAITAGVEAMTITAELVLSGMFHRFPKLRVILVESGIGWIPTTLEQLDNTYYRYRWMSGAVDKIKGMPSDIFWRNIWATFLVDRVGLQLRDWLNQDHICWSTDYPHSVTSWPHSRRTIEELFGGMPTDEVKRYLHTNTKNLYHLDHVPDVLSVVDYPDAPILPLKG